MKIYKYMHEDRIENILIDNLIRFTQPRDFNDPFEIKPVILGLVPTNELNETISDESLIKIITKEYDETPELNQKIGFNEYLKFAKTKLPKVSEIIESFTNNKQLPSSLSNTLYNSFNKTIGILSLTISNDNLLMWSHYANSHKGFVVEFDSENDFFKFDSDSENLVGKLQKVQYSEHRPKEVLSDFDVQKAFLTKSKEWEYENEYRMFHSFREAETSNGDINLFRIPVNAITGIYCGANMEEVNKNKVIKILNKGEEPRNIKLFQSQISEELFSLNFIEVFYSND